jgi:mono/diheme cytochrome c family protein
LAAAVTCAAWGCSDDGDTPKPRSDAAAAADASVDGVPSDAAGQADGAATEGGTADRAADTSASDAPAGDAGPDGAAGDAPATGDGPTGDAPVLTAQQMRGKYLAENVIGCQDCHTPQGPMGLDLTKFMAGACLVPGPSSTCLLASRNLTSDETGLKNRTDAEIKDMIKNGKRPVAAGGEALFPIMPYYVFANMNEADLDAIVAYLRTLPPIKNEVPRRNVMFDIPAPAPPLTLSKVPQVPDTFAEKASANRGKYLATQTGLCLECHTEHNMGPGPVLKEDKMFQGGEDFSMFIPIMMKIVSKNLTSDVETGLGNWTAADIVKVLKQGKDKEGKNVCPPMPTGPRGAYGGLTDADAMDIANYIKSLPAQKNMVPDMCAFPPGP